MAACREQVAVYTPGEMRVRGALCPVVRVERGDRAFPIRRGAGADPASTSPPLLPLASCLELVLPDISNKNGVVCPRGLTVVWSIFVSIFALCPRCRSRSSIATPSHPIPSLPIPSHPIASHQLFNMVHPATRPAAIHLDARTNKPVQIISKVLGIGIGMRHAGRHSCFLLIDSASSGMCHAGSPQLLLS